ncbi:MAG: hypothetical protein M0Z55_01985 [Peptococcaceae bacterium]|nr:hypothetical protein [Peptococcaceae bacterium]
MNNERINLARLKSDLYQHCEECNQNDNCVEHECLVGYALLCIDYANKSGTTLIAGGDKLIPMHDAKPYNLEFVAEGLAQTCIECKNCMDNHTSDCVIALSRNCLEFAYLQQPLPYSGNVITYLVDLAARDAALAQKTKEAFQYKK